MYESRNGDGNEFETNWTVVYAVAGLVTSMILVFVAGSVWNPRIPVLAEIPVHRRLTQLQPEAPSCDVSEPETKATTRALAEVTSVIPKTDVTTSTHETETSPNLVHSESIPAEVVEELATHVADTTVAISVAEPVSSEELLAEVQLAFISKNDVNVALDLREQSRELDPLAKVLKTAPESSSRRRPLTLGNGQFFHELIRESEEIRKRDIGLLFVGADDCKLGEKDVPVAAEVSVLLGRALASGRPTSATGGSQSASVQAPYVAHELLHTKSKDWQRPEAVGALVQILQVQPQFLREELIRFLSRIDGSAAAMALAERAMFDTSPEIRKVARHALSLRGLGDVVRNRLLGGFRYPWPPVSAFAAQALVELDDQESIPNLIELLDAPDPAAAFLNDEGSPVKRELVRLSHMRNCVICHAAASSKDPIRGFVPTPTQSLPRAYYQSRSGGSSFVRADITYLRQDFSLMHDVENAAPWPEWQRFDYLVQTRKLNSEEQARFTLMSCRDGRNELDTRSSSPQRDAVLFALRGLTAQDHGDTSDAWRASYAPIPAD
jgi:hypothetical protein